MSAATKPELTMELVTLVVHHTQDLESQELRFTPTGTQEEPSDTLARVRRLLEKGLISKTLKDAILDPRLWTTFLNANLREDQFLRVMSRSGDLPASIHFKSRPVADSDNTGDFVSERTIEVIRNKLPQVRHLAIDLAEVRSGTQQDPIANVMRLLEHPIPKLRTLSLTGPGDHPLGLTPSASSAPLFGGETPAVQHLHIMNVLVQPRTFANTLVSLSIGVQETHELADVLRPWIRVVKRGAVPRLRDLAICGPTSPREIDPFGNVLFGWAEIELLNIPNTIERVTIVGSITACRCISDQISISAATSLEFKLNFPSTDYDRPFYALNRSLMAHWNGEKCREISLVIRPDMVSWTLAGERSATVTWVASSSAAYQGMISAALGSITEPQLGLRLFTIARVTFLNVLEPVVSDTTWLTLDVVLAMEGMNEERGMATLAKISASLTQGFKFLKGARSLDIKRYDIIGQDPEGQNPWFDALGLFQYHDDGNEEACLLPGLRRIQLSQPGVRETDELRRAVLSYARRRDLAVRVTPRL